MSTPYDLPSVQAKLSSLMLYSLPFRLNPDNMAALTLPITLQWHQKPFKRENAAGIAEQPGVYAFAIAHGQVGLPPHNYILYIGQVGAKPGSMRTLRARFKDYFREKSRVKRLPVWYFLNIWETCLVFHFASVDPNTVNLLDIEKQLNDAMIPPFSQNDFSPKIQPMKSLAEILGPG